MGIDVVMLVVPDALDVEAGRRMAATLDADDMTAEGGTSPLSYRMAADAGATPDDDGLAVREHASRWVDAFVRLASGEDPFFESRIAHRLDLPDGRCLLTVPLDLDRDQPEYEDVMSLAENQYAAIARAMGVLLPGDFRLEVRTDGV